MTKSNKLALAVIRSSLVWGGLASLGFYALLHAGLVQGDALKRYFAGHWVEYVETIMFFVGLSELVLRAFDVSEQTSAVKEPLLGARPAEPRPAIEAVVLLDRLAELPAQRQNHYLPRRVREALEWVAQRDRPTRSTISSSTCRRPTPPVRTPPTPWCGSSSGPSRYSDSWAR